MPPAQVGDELAVQLRNRVADRVRELIVVAPSAINRLQHPAQEVGFRAVAVLGENSMLSVKRRAKRTASLACSCTCSGLIRSFFSMCSGEVAMKVWMRRFSQPASASAARPMSLSLARASEQTVESLTALAIARNRLEVAVAGGGEARLDHVHRRRSSCLAMRSFSSRVIEAPGLLLAIAQGGVEK